MEGLVVNPPPIDFDCLLNEPLWFNRFIKKDNGSSFGHYLTHEKIISNNGPLFIADVVVKSAYSSHLCFMDRANLQAKYDVAIAKVLIDLTTCIPIFWRIAIQDRTREKFIENEWVGQRKAMRNGQRPLQIYKIVACLSGKLRVMQYDIDPISSVILQTEDHNNINAIGLRKAHVVKAVVFVSPPSKSNSLIHIYCGSYLDRSLILSRIK
jgi:hypothetical protein